MSPHQRRWLAGCFLTLASIGLHLRSVSGEPVYLDSVAVPWAEAEGAHAGRVLEFALATIADPRGREPSGLWNPVPTLLLALCAALGDASVAAMHLVAVLAHTCAVLALWRLARGTGLDERTSLGAALLFAVHPVVVQSTSWISAAGVPLAGCLALLALGILVRDRSRGQAAAGLLFLLALLSSPQALAVLPAGWVLLRAKRVAARALLPLLGVAFVAYSLRCLAFRSWSAGYDDVLASIGSTWERELLSRVETIGGALRLLAWPVDWSLFRAPHPRPRATDLALEWSFLLGALAAWAVCAKLALHHCAAWLGALLASLIPLGLVCPWMAVFPLSDHHLYLSTALFAVFAAVSLRSLSRGIAVPALVLAGGYAYLANARIPSWSDDLTLLAEAAEEDGRLPRPHWLYAQELLAEFRRNGDVTALLAANSSVERAQDLLELSKQADSDVYATSEDFRQSNLTLGWCTLALAAVDSAHDYETARAVFETIVQSDPRNLQAFLGAGMACIGLRDFDGAESWFERARALDPDSPDVYSSLGKLEIERGNWRAAQAHFERALLARPGSLEDHLWLARSLHQQGLVDLARKHATLASELAPFHPEPMVLLGIVELSAGRSRKALDWIDRALLADPDDGFARLQRGHAFRARGELENAIVEYKRASDRLPENFEAAYSLGDALLALGREDVAAEQLARAYALQTEEALLARMHDVLRNTFASRAEVLFGFARIDFGRGRFGAADEWLAGVLSTAPDHAAALHMRGLIQRERGEMDAALESFAAAERIRPDSFQVQHDLGFQLLELARPEEALVHVERALALVPDTPEDPAAAEKLRAKLRAAIAEIRGG